MENISYFGDVRPSMLAAASGTVVAGVCASRTRNVTGQLAVAGAAVRRSVAPIFGMAGDSPLTSKINYMTTVKQGHEAQLGEAKGIQLTDARGIPPRGRPV